MFLRELATESHRPGMEDRFKHKQMKILILGAPLSTGNMGVSALAAGTVSAVRNSFPDSQVILMDYAKEPQKYSVITRDGPVSVEMVNIRFSKRFYLRNNIAMLLALAMVAGFLPNGRMKRSLLSRNPYLDCILRADIVVALSGGDSFSDIYGLARLLYMSLPQMLVLQMGKPLILLPQTLGPFKSAVAKAIGRFIMRRASVVYSRDKTSFEEAGRLLGPKREKLKFSHDMAFILEPLSPGDARLGDLPRRNGEGALIGLNVSGLLLMGGYSGDNMFGLKADYGKLLREIVSFFINEHRAQVILVPHVFGDESESDVSACARVFRELSPSCQGSLHLLRGSFNQHEIKYIIGQCDFFLGSRMHACIAAISQSVPAVCLAYSRKFIGVMESVGCAELVADLGSLDNKAVLDAVNRIFVSRARIQDSLRRRIPKVKDGVLGLFSHENLGAVADVGYLEGVTKAKTKTI